MIAVNEKALALIVWHPVQWQAAVISGAVEISIFTWPQRQAPAIGNLVGFICVSPVSRNRPYPTVYIAQPRLSRLARPFGYRLGVTEGRPLMARKPEKQVGAVPWRKRRGRLEILLVTSRETQRWVIPKGGVMPQLVDMNAARQEAFEEAGIAGRMQRETVGTYTYRKQTGDGPIMHYAVKVFLLEVQHEFGTWPEKRERTRRWFSVEEAMARIGEPGLRRIIRACAKDGVR